MDESFVGKKQKRSDSRLDFDSCAHVITAADNSGKSFSEMGQTTQYAIKKKIKREVDMLFVKYMIDRDADCLDCLKFIANHHQSHSTRDRNVKNDTVINKVLSKLKLSDRDKLVRLLTHNGEEINNEVLEIHPSLRHRSEILLKAGARKTRRDKIDLQFISDFMHSACRYDPAFVK